MLKQKSPTDLCKRINEALQQAPDWSHPPNIVAAKQLKSGDISIHTATSADAALLRRNPEAWTGLLGSQARALIPTYGVLVHGVRTNKENIDPDDQKSSTERIQTENSALHPGARINYVGWLSKQGTKKTASSLVIEVTTKEHADRVIREGLVLGACHHNCELYDKSCKPKQCYKCQSYGHIGTQCSAEIKCGYCAEPHDSRQCHKKDESSFVPKCALCKEQHTTWSNKCRFRGRELERIEIAKRNRPQYHSTTAPQPLLGNRELQPSQPSTTAEKTGANNGSPSPGTRAQSTTSSRIIPECPSTADDNL